MLCLFVARPLVIAHRGASAEAPENTLAAFARALALGADGVELDVRMSRDGIPVVFHDATLSRLAGLRRRVGRLTFAELRAVRIAGEAIPSLADVLALIRGRILTQIELKTGAAVESVARVVRQSGAADRVILASFAAEALRAAQQLAPEIPRMLIADRRRLHSAASTLARIDALGLSVDHRDVVSPDFIARLHDRRRRAWCWTVNEPAAMTRLAGWGADALLSDNPALLNATLSQTLN